jgi:hypothetical protein
MGFVLVREGNVPEARKQFELALENDPGLTSAREALDSLK